MPGGRRRGRCAVQRPSDGRLTAARATGRVTEVLLAAGFMAVVAGCCAAALLPPQLTAQRVAALAVVVGGFAAVAGDVVAALAPAGMAWLFCNGFLIDRLGLFRWHARFDPSTLATPRVRALFCTGPTARLS